jgi:alpha-beta hydrolase superfamily lysophospholipase
VARELGANLYYTRLSGHGVPGDQLGQVSVHDWIRDVTEAVSIGEALGERVILMGTSTGATLAAWAAAQPELAANLAGIVLVSPNFGPNDARADMLLWPWGRQILHVVQGDTFRWEPANADHERYWTRSYPTDALLPMMAVVKLAREAGLSSSRVPVFVAWSPDDRVVDPDITAEMVLAMDSTRVDTMIVRHALDRNQHVIAGDILSPNTSEQVAARMISFIRGLPTPTRLP